MLRPIQGFRHLFALHACGGVRIVTRGQIRCAVEHARVDGAVYQTTVVLRHAVREARFEGRRLEELNEALGGRMRLLDYGTVRLLCPAGRLPLYIDELEQRPDGLWMTSRLTGRLRLGGDPETLQDHMTSLARFIR